MVTKWIIVTGGVVSGIGKGTAAASIGKLLSDGHKIVPVKCDGYLNVDPGTMNPFEHGEVFVLDDGGEVDMDFGHYERFLNVNCKSGWNLTTGKIFDSVIQKERKGDYLGKTVQVIPHITNEIKNRFKQIASEEKADIMIVEIGGTMGDIENSWFTEAVRQMKKEVGADNIMYVHLTYIPFLHNVGQQKTKPAQRDVQQLRELGIWPDIIIARTEHELVDEARKKIALFCDVDEEAVISGKDIETIYEIPQMFERQKLGELVARHFGIELPKNLGVWKQLVENIKNPEKEINVAICGKYTALNDSYASIIEALTHAGAHLKTKVNVSFVESTEIENGKLSVSAALKGKNAVIVPIGFGSRGVEGKIACIKYARENNIPFLGLCFGLQMAVIEFARNVCNLKDANSTEVDAKTPYPVIEFLPEQVNVKKLGGTMRLGSYDAELKPGSIVAQLYNSAAASERHRHRWEVNPEYHKILQEKGMVFSGSSEKGRLVEFIELPASMHKYFVATQAHPEYKSRLDKPSPLFYGLVKAAVEK